MFISTNKRMFRTYHLRFQVRSQGCGISKLGLTPHSTPATTESSTVEISTHTYKCASATCSLPVQCVTSVMSVESRAPAVHTWSTCICTAVNMEWQAHMTCALHARACTSDSDLGRRRAMPCLDEHSLEKMSECSVHKTNVRRFDTFVSALFFSPFYYRVG